MEASRIALLNRSGTAQGRYVLYWMQQSQRAETNPALEHAIRLANEQERPLLVGFGLMDDYPEATLRHYAFMLEGLAETGTALARRGIGFAVRRGRPDDVALALSEKASLVVCDKGYLRHQRQWRARVAAEAGRAVVEVEGDVVVPVALASNKSEHAARTIRPKLLRCRDEFLLPLEEQEPRHRAGSNLPRGDIDLADADGVLGRLRIDRSVDRVDRFKGGTRAARARLTTFLQQRFADYVAKRSEPVARACSELSPYLHFGQISPVEVAMAARNATAAGDEAKAGFLEELVVRRELAMNFVAFEEAYDRFEALPQWARQTLATHRTDHRPHLYDEATLAEGATHDPYWNAAMREMTRTGYMHNYMRMYWGKKILEWTADPEQAFATALRLNNRYFLDGRDPNSYANVAWCFGLHDRPWANRPIFGTVRYMNDKGLERKFDIDAYVRWSETL